jgi:small nuclear ribonucleoprotein
MALPLDVLEKAMNQRLNLLLKDGRTIQGKLIGYDEYMNLVLDESEETQMTRKGRFEGKTSHFKKAIVTLKEGDKIDFLANV